MDRIAEFFDMGGRAEFVWPAYGLTAIVLIGVLVASLRSLRARDRELERFKGRRPERRK